VGEAAQFFRVLWGQWIHYASRAEYGIALELGEQCLELAQSARDPALLVEAHHAIGVSCCVAGEFVKALEHLDQAIALYDPKRHASHAYSYGQDPAAVCHIHAAWCLWFQGYPDQALKRNDEGLALARKSTHPGNLATTTAFAALPQQLCRNGPAVRKLAETSVQISTEHNFAYSRGMGIILAGWALTQQGCWEEGTARMQQGLDALRVADAVLMVPYFSSLLAEVYGEVGQANEGLSLLSGVDPAREPYWEAELYRVKGELILKQAGDQKSQQDSQVAAENCFRQALAVARAQKAKSLELRASAGLSRLWIREGRASEAQHLMTEIFAWFREGFDTPDLREAKALVEQLRTHEARFRKEF
jgi:predicted ATPase